MTIIELAKRLVPAAYDRLEGDWEPSEGQTPIEFAMDIIEAERQGLAEDDDYRLPIDLPAGVFAEALLQAMAQHVIRGYPMLHGVAAMIKKDGRCGQQWDPHLGLMLGYVLFRCDEAYQKAIEKSFTGVSLIKPWQASIINRLTKGNKL